MGPEVDAFILAAGLGTRMGPLSQVLPKPAWPLQGRPLLQWCADSLRRAGFRNVACNAHHLPGFLEGALAGSGIEVFREPQLLGSAGGLGHVRGRAAEPLAVWNGDILADAPWAAFLEAHRRLGADLSWLLVPHPGGPWNPVWLSRDGRILPPGETGAGALPLLGAGPVGPRGLGLDPRGGPRGHQGAHPAAPGAGHGRGGGALPLPGSGHAGPAHRSGPDPRPSGRRASARLLCPSHRRARRPAAPVRPGARSRAAPCRPGRKCTMVPGRRSPSSACAIDLTHGSAIAGRP